MSREKAEEVSIVKKLCDMAPGVLKNIRSIQNLAKKSLEKHKRIFQEWLVKVAVMAFSVFMCLTFLILGLFFIAIDYGGIPRGIVFVCGGLLGLLVLRLMIPSTK
jgi:hypothetical protein